MKLSLLLLADPKCSLYDYKAGAAIPYTLIRWTRKAAESSSFQIMAYHTSLWQAGNDSKIVIYSFFFSGAELSTCHRNNHEQSVYTDLSYFFPPV